jgi:hypothetical protein
MVGIGSYNAEAKTKANLNGTMCALFVHTYIHIHTYIYIYICMCVCVFTSMFNIEYDFYACLFRFKFHDYFILFCLVLPTVWGTR